ncbi:GDP-mannose 4,6-dehydratase [Chitinispirillum alkaliphilum]|nr:GDP-mannose 4,6-dehydratase [Chitinispirillum alkaliphilum]
MDIQEKPVLDYINYRKLSLPGNYELDDFLKSTNPLHIYHLAAVSYIPDADLSPYNAIEINLMGTVSVLEAALRTCPESQILVVGSSKEYGEADSATKKITENTNLNPQSFYGITKFTSELIAKQYGRQFGLDVRFTRSFNHTGPGQSPKFVCSDWAKQVADIDRGLTAPRVEVGDLEHSIDFCDVRDVVKAYHLILKHGKRGDVYNVCSGRTVPLTEILDYLIRKSGKKIEIIKSDFRIRPGKRKLGIAGDNEKLVSQTGWNPQIGIDKTLDDLYECWFNR